jgi:hypothetical protein
MVGPRREDFRMVALTALAGAVLRLPKHDPMVQFRLQRKALLARPVWTCLDSGQVDLWSDSRWYVDDPDTVRKLIEDASCRYCNGLMEYFRPPVRGEIGGLVACGVPYRSRSDHGLTGKDGTSSPRISAKKARGMRSGFDRALCIRTSSGKCELSGRFCPRRCNSRVNPRRNV